VQQGSCFSITKEWTWAIILPLKGFIGFYAQSMMFGQSIFVGLNMTDEDLEPCPYQIQHPWVHQRWLMGLLRLKFWCS
jgi:hypothetical protein